LIAWILSLILSVLPLILWRNRSLIRRRVLRDVRVLRDNNAWDGNKGRDDCRDELDLEIHDRLHFLAPGIPDDAP
jgi:hypothetical protein